MIIREIIMWLSIMRKNQINFPEVGSDNKIKALSEALVIIHKYQKIDQIMSDGYLKGKSSGEMLLGIKEVMNRNDK